MKGRAKRFLIGERHARSRLLKREKLTKTGFTMVEFSLAAAFVGVLLITISGVVLNITEIYRKGLTLKSLNTVGRELVDDIEGSIQKAASLPDQDSDMDTYVRYQVYEDSMSGMFCTGSYTYVWNNRAATESGYGLGIEGGGKTLWLPRLAKVLDTGRNLCNNWTGLLEITYVADSGEEPEELLDDSDVDLYVYSWNVGTNKPAIQIDATGTQAFIAGSFMLGTDGEDGAQISNCERTENDEYCAINTFKFAARTAGKVD